MRQRPLALLRYAAKCQTRPAPRRRRSPPRAGASARCRRGRSAALPRRRVDRERRLRPVGADDDLALEVDRRPRARSRSTAPSAAHVVLGQLDRRAARSCVQFVRKMSANDGAMTPRSRSPRAPTARARATSRSRSCGRRRGSGARRTRAGSARTPGRALLGVVAPVVEQELAEAGPLDALEELLRDDLVGVDVGPVEDRDARRSTVVNGFIRRSSQSRMSTKWPAIAAAAAICGLTRCVRPPWPWRPSKLRFEVEAQRSPGARMSGFMPRHIEQPASRHSKPASREDLVEALRLGLAPSPAASRGRPSRGTRSATLRPADDRRRRRAGPRCASSCTSR